LLEDDWDITELIGEREIQSMNRREQVVYEMMFQRHEDDDN